jgi:hypothetical protein
MSLAKLDCAMTTSGRRSEAVIIRRSNADAWPWKISKAPPMRNNTGRRNKRAIAAYNAASQNAW